MALEIAGLGDTAYTEPLFWTPGAIQNLAATCHSAMLNFQNDMAKNLAKVPANELAAWRVLRDQWSKWYGATDWSTWMWSSNVSVIEGYLNQLKDFEAKFKIWTGTMASGAGVPEIKNPLAALSSPVIWIGVGVAAALGLVLYLRLGGGGGGTTKIELDTGGGNKPQWSDAVRAGASRLAQRIAR